MKLLIFVPARQGSKGLKDKNFKTFNGKPLIYSTLAFSKKIEKQFKGSMLFFSTDSKKYLNYAKKKLYTKNNYLRPKALSGDNSLIVDSLFHAIDWLKNKNLYFDTALVLQPTSPLRIFSEVKKAVLRFKKKNYKTMASVTRMSEHPFECIKKKKNSKWNFLEKPKKIATRRQEYSNSKLEYFFIDGSFYISNLEFLKKNKNFVVERKTELFTLKGKRAPDIDDIYDFKFAELYSNKNFTYNKS